MKSSGASPLNKTWGLGVLPLPDLHPSSSPAGRGGEGTRGARGELGYGALRRWGVSAAATSVSTVVLGRPPIYDVHRLCRGVHQRGTQDDDHRPAPAPTGQQETIFDFNLRIWRPFFDSGMASIVSLAPSGLFPGGEVVGAQSWARRTGGDRGPDRVFEILFRGLNAFF
jgi:hypothetical protein